MNLKKFKPIPGYSKYMISEYGDVYSLVRNKIIAVAKNWAGYLTVTITDDNGFRSPRKVHRLVYRTYIGEFKEGMIIDHKDDNKLNNHYSNLQQITPSENSLKTFISGKNKDKVVWTKDQIHMICEMMEKNVYSVTIFTNLGVDYYSNRIACNTLLGQLRRGQIRKDVTSQYDLSNYITGVNKKDARFNIAEVRNVYMRMFMGEKPAALAREYNVTFSTICKIRDKKTWKKATDFVDQYFEDEPT